MKKFLLSCSLIVLALSGCDRDAVDDLKSSAPRALGAGLDAIQRQVDSVAPSIQTMKEEQIDSLYKVEYLVKDFSTELSAQEVEATLQQLGLDGWECFSIIHNQTLTTDRYMFKKRPRSFVPLILRLLH